MPAAPGKMFVAAVAARDIDALHTVLAREIDFRGLTPGRFWEASTPGEVVEGQAYYKVGEGQLTYLRVVCSGFQPRTV